MKVCAIVAMDEGRVIGVDNKLPWHIPEDLKRFSQLTKGHTVLMGRKTFFSLPEKFRPLPERKNLVCTRDVTALLEYPQVTAVSDLNHYLSHLAAVEESLPGDILWIIGGEEIYRISLDRCEELHITKVPGKHQGDAYFPEFEDRFELLEEERYDTHSFVTYRRKS